MQDSASKEPDAFIERFLARIPADSGVTFSDTQLAIIRDTLGNWTSRHAVDIRLSVPLWRRVYLVLLMGPERRDRDRRNAERGQHPLLVLGNVIFFLTFIGTLTVVVVLYHTVIFEWLWEFYAAGSALFHNLLNAIRGQ